MADDVQSFEFKPALMRGRDNWTLDAGFLTRNGELFCSLDNVAGVRFAQLSARHTHSSWLDLTLEDRKERISCNLPPGDESNSQFLALAAAILADLETRKPDLKVAFGAGGAVRIAMFAIGLLALVFGLIVWIILANGGVRESRALMAFLFAGGFVLFGGGLAWSYRPWAPAAMVPVETARLLVAGLALDDQPEQGQDDGEAPEDREG